MKRIFLKTTYAWLAGVSLACAVALTSCSTGTGDAETNVEQSGAKDFTDPDEANRTTPDTATTDDPNSGLEHYEQTYGGAKEEPTNPDINTSTPRKPETSGER